jgi:hypothetical protein
MMVKKEMRDELKDTAIEILKDHATHMYQNSGASSWRHLLSEGSAAGAAAVCLQALLLLACMHVTYHQPLSFDH